ncbi:MAG TPA: amidohydrolase [Anaerolineae bacterium]|nr:amidohydrolase [Anaerolineae bacterium]
MSEVDLILRNATVVCMDDAFRIFEVGAVAIRHHSILDVGHEERILKDHASEEVIDCSGKTLIPGLINAHTHAPMTILRGLADDRRLDVWLLGYVMPVEREFVSPEFCLLGAKLACAEMIRSGITCFADMYYFEHAVAEAAAEVGMRAICGQSVLKFPTPDAASFEDAMDAGREFIRQWKDHDLIIPSIAPHAAYTSTLEILRACIDLAVEYDVPLLTHLAETSQEVEDSRDQYDMPVIPWVKKAGLFEAKVLAAHCVHVDEGEIHSLRRVGSGVVHNPSSNMKLASGFAPIYDMLEAGLNVGLGTDGTASNNDLDMFEEMRLAAFLAKGTTGDPTALPARQVFSMATRLGAKACHIDHLVGSIEIGKRADLTLIDLDTLHNLPRFDIDQESIYSRLVYAAKSTDVTDVMVNGRWLMLDRRLQTVEEKPLLEQAQQIADQIDAFLAEREGSVLSKLIAIGGAEQEESYEVQIKLSIPDPSPIIQKLESQAFEIIRTAHYREYDCYFGFSDPTQGRLRHREDEFIDSEGNIYNVRYRLTLAGPAAERTYPNSVLLSRSRFIAPATHSLRFYKEYFQPEETVQISKDRLRWLVLHQDEEFFINIDQILKPKLEGWFLEVKSRTWSRRDAERKAELISDVLKILEVDASKAETQEYPELIATQGMDG